MTDEQLKNFEEKLKKNLDETQMGTIQDALGILATDNSNVVKEMHKQADEIKDLKEMNEKLVYANGNLLKQVQTQVAERPNDNAPEDQEPKENPDDFDFSSVLDKSGRLKH